MKRVSFTRKEGDAYVRKMKRAPCFICEIVAGGPRRKLHHILYEDDQTIAFFSLLSTQYGYTLVCPKRHVEQLASDMKEAEYLYLQKIIFVLCQAVMKVIKPVRIYVASLGSNDLNKHVHFHIVPLPEGVPLLKQQMVAMMPEEGGIMELTETEWKNLAEKIRAELERALSI